jgi:hypothetical protein
MAKKETKPERRKACKEKTINAREEKRTAVRVTNMREELIQMKKTSQVLEFQLTVIQAIEFQKREMTKYIETPIQVI